MKTVLITGGSSGIGYELSGHFARAGYRLLWVSKPPEELQQAKELLLAEKKNLEIHLLAKDLSVPAAAQEVYDWVEQNNWSVDVLVNNAGIGTYGFLQDTSFEKELKMINLNLVNVYQMTRLFLSEMIKIDKGTIINISSNSALQPIPRMNTYAATKAFVKHFTEGLQEELKIQRSRVKAIVVCPSAVQDTPFKTAAAADKVKTFQGLAFTTAAEVASDIWKGYTAGKTLIVTGSKMRLIYAIRGLLPYSLKKYLVRKETEEQ